MSLRHPLFSIIAIAIIFTNCEKKEIPLVKSSIDSLPLQSFTINPEKDTVIKGRKGSSFYIPANALEDEKGNPVKGGVQISLLEVNSPEDFIRSGITTEANGEILISDGSYYINATQDGKGLGISKGKSIYARLPVEKKDSEMRFFTGELTDDGNVNWSMDINKKPLSENVPASLKKKSANIKAVPNGNAVMSITPAEHTALIAEFNDLSMYLHDNIYNEETHYVKLGQWYVPEAEADRLTKSKYGVSYSEYQPFNRYQDYKQKKEAEDIWESDKDLGATPFKYRASIVEARDKRYKELCKKLGIGTPEKPSFSSKATAKINKPMQEKNESWDDFIRRSDEAYKKEFGTEAYIFALQNLGWFNIDKYDNREQQKYEGLIADKEGKPVINQLEVHLVSRKNKIHLKTLTENGYYKFRYPKNKSFDIVFVAGSEGVTKTFDGTSVDLEEIRLNQEL